MTTQRNGPPATKHQSWCDKFAHEGDFGIERCFTPDRLTGNVAVFAFADAGGEAGIELDVSKGSTTFSTAEARDLAQHLGDLADLLDGR